jgi:hypothetical protein
VSAGSIFLHLLPRQEVRPPRQEGEPTTEDMLLGRPEWTLHTDTGPELWRVDSSWYTPRRTLRQRARMSARYVVRILLLAAVFAAGLLLAWVIR